MPNNTVKENGRDTPQTIIFCQTMYAIASVVNYLMKKLKEMGTLLGGHFNSMSHQENKKKMVTSLVFLPSFFAGSLLCAIKTELSSLHVFVLNPCFIAHFTTAFDSSLTDHWLEVAPPPPPLSLFSKFLPYLHIQNGGQLSVIAVFEAFDLQKTTCFAGYKFFQCDRLHPLPFYRSLVCVV